MRSGLVFVAAGLLLAVAGCTPSSPATSTPSPRATPVFASDAAALKAAEAAYAAYLKVSTQITGDGGSGASRIDPLVTRAQAVREHRTYTYFSSNSLHTSGSPSFSALQLQQLTFDQAGGARVSFYTCVDASNVRVLNTSNADVTPTDRADTTPLEVTVVSKASDRHQLLISESSKWPDSNICS